MQRSIIYMGICILSVTILLMVTEGVYSQIPPPVQDRVKPDTTLHGEKPGGDIVLGPVADSQVYMETYHDPYRIQNGVFLGRGIIGSETTFRQTESPFHFTGSLGVFSHDTGVRSDSYLFAGISAGREYLLNDYTFNSGSSRTELYVRLSPGVILVTDGLTGRDTGYYPGVTGAGITGAQYDLSKPNVDICSRRRTVYMAPCIKRHWCSPVTDHLCRYSVYDNPRCESGSILATEPG
jgi:hypothetical protein